MSRREKASVLRIELPISIDRFDEILEGLSAGRRISKKMREEIAQLLEYLFFLTMRDKSIHRRGAKPNPVQWERAEMVRILEERHGCTRGKAIYAVLPNGTSDAAESLERTIRRVASGKGIFGEVRIEVNPRFLDEAERRLLGGHK